jgi:hypothetical protein
MKQPRIYVRNTRARFSFDGQTGIVVLAGTTGEVSALTLLAPNTSPRPRLTVYWDAAVVQDKANDESSTYEGWEESEIDPEDLEFVRAEIAPEPAWLQCTACQGSGHPADDGSADCSVCGGTGAIRREAQS